MAHGVSQYFEATVDSFATSSSEVDLGRAFPTAYLVIPTMTSNTAIHIQGCEESGGTFRRVYHPSINSSTVTTNVFTIASATTNAIVPIPNALRYLKVETTATISFTAAFRVICGE